MRVLALTMAVALAAGPALATETQATDKDAEKDKVVCRYEQRTGTKFSKKVCMTKAQWEQMAAEARADLRQSMGNNGTAPVEAPVFHGGQ